MVAARGEKGCFIRQYFEGHVFPAIDKIVATTGDFQRGAEIDLRVTTPIFYDLWFHVFGIPQANGPFIANAKERRKLGKLDALAKEARNLRFAMPEVFTAGGRTFFGKRRHQRMRKRFDTILFEEMPDFISQQFLGGGKFEDLNEGVLPAMAASIAKASGKGDTSAAKKAVSMFFRTVILVVGAQLLTNFVCWILKYFSTLPKDMKLRIVKELRKNPSPIVTRSDVSNKDAPFFKALFHETLRLRNGDTSDDYSPARTIKVKVDGHTYTIPKGSVVLYHVFEPSLQNYERPLEFDLGRWIDKEQRFCALKNFRPFGVGKRDCAGKEWAKELALCVAGTLLKRYDFEMSAEQRRKCPQLNETFEAMISEHRLERKPGMAGIKIQCRKG